MAFGSPLFVGAERIEADRSAGDSGRPSTLEAEVDRLLSRLSDVGAEADSLLAVDVFVADDGTAWDGDDIRVELARLLPEDARPVVSVVPVAALAGAAVVLQAMAVPADRTVLWGEARFPAAASRRGYFALTSGATDSAGDVSAGHGSAGTVAERAVAGGLVEQSRVALAEVSILISELGGAPDDVILADMDYVAGGSREEWEEAALARAGFFADPGPCATGITLTRVAALGGLIQFRMLGVIGSRAAGDVRDAWPDRPWTWPFPLPYRHGNRVGKLMVVVGGQSSRGPHGSVMRGEDAPTQAGEAVRSVRSVLEALSSSLEDVVRLTAYYVGSDADYDSVRLNIVAAMPETGFDLSLVRVDHLAHEQMLVEIEGLAWSRS